jgi:outer membrane protein OmpA-like peptidoglycan-associated protein
VPVTFVFNEATLTSDGHRAAELLLEYLQLKRFSRIKLTGHADERGTDALNLALSAQRLQTVSRFLRDGGFKGELDLVPRGKAEPYMGVVRADFSQEDLWQLDRRVELIVSR